MPKPLDIICNGVQEEDGTFTLIMHIKGIETHEHCRDIGLALEPRVHEAIELAVRTTARILRPN